MFYAGNLDKRRERLARAYDAADTAYVEAFRHRQRDTVRTLYARREALWKAYKRLGIGRY